MDCLTAVLITAVQPASTNKNNKTSCSTANSVDVFPVFELGINSYDLKLSFRQISTELQQESIFFRQSQHYLRKNVEGQRNCDAILQFNFPRNNAILDSLLRSFASSRMRVLLLWKLAAKLITAG